jgi:hypothetical protein
MELERKKKAHFKLQIGTDVKKLAAILFETTNNMEGFCKIYTSQNMYYMTLYCTKPIFKKIYEYIKEYSPVLVSDVPNYSRLLFRNGTQDNGRAAILEDNLGKKDFVDSLFNN